jgi:hypothetical protein
MLDLVDVHGEVDVLRVAEAEEGEALGKVVDDLTGCVDRRGGAQR